MPVIFVMPAKILFLCYSHLLETDGFGGYWQKLM